jgi:hypothetical protein
MDESIKKALESLKGSKSLAESLGLNSATNRMMEDLAKSVKNIPNYNMPALREPQIPRFDIPSPPSQKEINNYQSASQLMQAIAEEALSWKRQLPENYTPAILAFLYGGVQIHVQTLSQVSFHGIKIEGTLNGSPCSLLAHQSTVQLLCYGEEVKAEVPKRPIGFIWGETNIEV